MSRAGIAENVLLGIEKEITSCDEVGFKFPTERIVQPGEDLRGIARDG